MATKGSKLTKLKSMLKRWPSMSRMSSRSNSSNSISRSSSVVAANPVVEDDSYNSVLSSNNNDRNNIVGDEHEDEEGLQAVYVGKSRRRYLVSSQVIDHPLVQVLAGRSSDGMTVECEVVLFQHLLWMLENADPQPDSLDELVDFYAC
ncbi:PREDICTED: uncharacterized protein LOC104600475 [Nelumbo nucifera]|uniref:Auxin-responsive protein SAUR76-like n=2 Tax=Nelumbo nucifera TaxID=4432 RepID=A0A822ZL57_NELNU|nr:PREDICTED: uncharacterized protein LOC104600475 [Nelumbo nucifera]DAD44175.1 TPA_asm: hypothetical protein HUJ06_002405 [Nelumbo nucifera]